MKPTPFSWDVRLWWWFSGSLFLLSWKQVFSMRDWQWAGMDTHNCIWVPYHCPWPWTYHEKTCKRWPTFFMWLVLLKYDTLNLGVLFIVIGFESIKANLGVSMETKSSFDLLCLPRKGNSLFLSRFLEMRSQLTAFPEQRVFVCIYRSCMLGKQTKMPLRLL